MRNYDLLVYGKIHVGYIVYKFRRPFKCGLLQHHDGAILLEFEKQTVAHSPNDLQ